MAQKLSCPSDAPQLYQQQRPLGSAFLPSAARAAHLVRPPQSPVGTIPTFSTIRMMHFCGARVL